MSEKTEETRRKTVRLGRRFAGSIATRLDAHPSAPDSARLRSEKEILELARELLNQTDPDPCVTTFLTQAVEVHTKTFGFSKAIYDELFKLHRRRLKNQNDPNAEDEPEETRFKICEGRPLKSDVSRFMVKV